MIPVFFVFLEYFGSQTVDIVEGVYKWEAYSFLSSLRSVWVLLLFLCIFNYEFQELIVLFNIGFSVSYPHYLELLFLDFGFWLKNAALLQN